MAILGQISLMRYSRINMHTHVWISRYIEGRDVAPETESWSWFLPRQRSWNVQQTYIKLEGTWNSRMHIYLTMPIVIHGRQQRAEGTPLCADADDSLLTRFNDHEHWSYLERLHALNSSSIEVGINMPKIKSDATSETQKQARKWTQGNPQVRNRKQVHTYFKWSCRRLRSAAENLKTQLPLSSNGAVHTCELGLNLLPDHDEEGSIRMRWTWYRSTLNWINSEYHRSMQEIVQVSCGA